MGSMGWTSYSVVDPTVTQVFIFFEFSFPRTNYVGTGRGNRTFGGEPSPTAGKHLSHKIQRSWVVGYTRTHSLYWAYGDW